MIGGPSRRSTRDRAAPSTYQPSLTFSPKSHRTPNNNKKRTSRKTDMSRRIKRARTPYAPMHDTDYARPRDPVPTPRITTININDLSSEAITVESSTRRSQAADYIEDLLRTTDILAVQETGLRIILEIKHTFSLVFHDPKYYTITPPNWVPQAP